MPFEVVERVALRHNPLNAVTASNERVSDASGATSIRKELRSPSSAGNDGGRWDASGDPGAASKSTHKPHTRCDGDAPIHPRVRDTTNPTRRSAARWVPDRVGCTARRVISAGPVRHTIQHPLDAFDPTMLSPMATIDNADAWRAT